MLSSIKKDKNYHVEIKKFEIKRLQLKVFLQDLSLKNECLKIENQSHKENCLSHTASSPFILSQNLLSRLPRNSSKTRVKNRCIETGRSRSVLRFCKFSRIILREKASKGIIPGVSKASW